MRRLACDAVQYPCCPTLHAFASGEAETAPKKKTASKAEWQTRRPVAAMNAIIAGMGRVRTPDLTNKNADVKRKEKNNDRGSVMQCKHI